MNATLIQIVSEETMPNLLAAMAIKPERIVHLCTSSMAGTSAALERAYGQAQVKTVVDTCMIGGNPDIVEMSDSVRKAIAKHGNPVVNLTGGTKLMSIGAYVAATRAGTTSLYVDTAAGRFVDGLSGGNFQSLFPDGAEVTRVSKQLMVNSITTANGVERVTGGKPWKNYSTIAELLLGDFRMEQKCHDIVADIIKGEPRNFAQAQAYFRKLYSKPLSVPGGLGVAAVSAGLLEERGGVCYPAPRWLDALNGLDFSGGKIPGNLIYSALNEARWPFAFFNGNWWEIAVMRYLSERNRYRDLRWSVDAGSRFGSSTDMEEDILGVDGVNLLYVSCKRGGDKAKLSRVLEDVNSSARRLGGKFAHKMLAVFVDLQGMQRTRLVNRCKELHIELLDRAAVASIL